MTIWNLMNGGVPDNVGLLATMIDEANTNKAAKQFDDNYQHGGGWRNFTGFKLDTETMELTYPGDPPMLPVAMTTLRDETIYVYPYAWVVILQPDQSFEVSRMD